MIRKTIYLTAVCLFCAAFQNPKAEELTLRLSRPLVLKWLREQGAPITVPPGSHRDSLYVQSPEGAVTSILLPGGHLQWRSDIGGHLSAGPVADGRAVYVASESVSVDPGKPQGVVAALSNTSGITIWSQTLTSPIQGQLLVLDDALYGATRDGRLVSFNSETGAPGWTTQIHSPFSGNITLANRRLIASTADGVILSFDGRTGKQAWRYRTPDRARSTVVAAGSKVFVGSANGYLTALEETAGGVTFKWRRRVGTSVTGLTHSPQGVIAITGDNFVQLLSHRHGARLWKRRMPGRVLAQPLIDSRSALFATLGGDACIVLSLESGKQVNVISVGEGNQILTTPILTQTALIVPTRKGLMAFGQPDVN